MTNAREFLTGANPIKLRFHNLNEDWRNAAPQQGFKLRWFGELGNNYSVESSSDLQIWNRIAERPGNSQVEEVSDSSGGVNTRFYRLQVQSKQTDSR